MSADYEEDVFSLTSPDGELLKVVRHNRDGIFFADPVKAMVYGADGRTIADTPYYRDVVFWRTSAHTFRLFGVGAFGYPGRTWDFDGKQFAERYGLLGDFLPILASPFKRPIGYGVAMLFLVFGVLGLVRWLWVDNPWVNAPG